MTAVSRRTFIQQAAALSLGAHPLAALAASPDASELLLVGTQKSGSSKGIYAYRFDASAGNLQPLGLAGETDSPTFLAIAPNGKTVFAINEVETYRGRPGGSLCSFAFDAATAKLTLLNTVSSRGAGPCHIAVDHTGRCVFVANYSGGSIASYRVTAGGQLGEAVSFFQYAGSGPDKTNQTSPHAHRVTVSPDNRFLLVNDLGLDLIHIYRLDAATAALSPNQPLAWKAAPGSGPRALQFHPNGRFAYCVAELTSTVSVLSWNAQTGTLETTQEVPLLPAQYHGEGAAADIVLDRTGRFAYAASRINDFIAAFAVSPADGRLTLLGRSSCGGKMPRHLALDKSERWLLVANQDTDTIAAFARDPHTGLLANEGRNFPLARPQCIVFA